MSLLSAEDRRRALADLTDAEAEQLLYDWHFWARPKQLPPPGNWATWILRAGRGFGKTRTGSSWVHARAMEHPGRWIALVARTPADARDYMIEGPGGFLRNIHPAECPRYEPSKRRLTWPNGSWATIYSDEAPDQLRGFSGDTAWLDEFAKFSHSRECWDNLQFGMREVSGDRPRQLITTTPRPLKILTEIEASAHTVTVIGSSYENRANLDPIWLGQTLAAYEGTRLGRQEIHAEILDDNPNALWQRSWIERLRVVRHPALVRIVVGVDPPGGDDESAAYAGIVVAGVGQDGHGYVLDDCSQRGTPEQWGRAAVTAYHKHKADRLIAEINYGGAMVASTLRAVDAAVPVKVVTASRGKQLRAEPISALYESNRVHHVGTYPELEDQMCEWVPGAKSPDRLDALVWALTELMATSKKYADAWGR